MAKNTHYFSVSKAQWHHIGFNTVYEMRAQQANENSLAALREKQHSQVDKTMSPSDVVFIEE